MDLRFFCYFVKHIDSMPMDTRAALPQINVQIGCVSQVNRCIAAVVDILFDLFVGSRRHGMSARTPAQALVEGLPSLQQQKKTSRPKRKPPNELADVTRASWHCQPITLSFEKPFAAIWKGWGGAVVLLEASLLARNGRD